MKQLYVIGMGPGGADQLTPQARLALEESQVLCGYTTYLDLAREFQEGIQEGLERQWRAH